MSVMTALGFGSMRVSTARIVWLGHRYLFLKLCATPRFRDSVDVLVGKDEREKHGLD
jgi:hypothetical protein